MAQEEERARMYVRVARPMVMMMWLKVLPTAGPYGRTYSRVPGGPPDALWAQIVRGKEYLTSGVRLYDDISSKSHNLVHNYAVINPT